MIDLDEFLHDDIYFYYPRVYLHTAQYLRLESQHAEKIFNDLKRH